MKLDPRRGPLVPLLLLLFVCTSAAWAQSVSDGTLTGTVGLSSGERIPGVTVRITSPALVAGERQVISDSDGRFVFMSLPPGTYGLTATLEGFKTFTTRGLRVRSADKVDLKVTLEQGAYEEQIVVMGVAPLVDTKSSTVETTFTEDMLEKIPTARSAFYDLAMGAPGMASVGSEESWLSSPSAYGSAANENIFLVNGVNTTNPRGAPWGSLVNVNYNMVEEVKVLSLGSKAEYGSFSGAAIDVLTKSGGNSFMGDVSYHTMAGNAADNYTLDFGSLDNGLKYKVPDPRTSNPNDYLENYYAIEGDVLTSIPQSSKELSLTFGGPMLKDRLWFYGGYSGNDSETDTPLFEPLSLWTAKLYDLKLTGDFSAKHRAWAAYHREDLNSGNTTWGQTWDGSMAYDSDVVNDTWQLQYQWVISDRDLLSAKYLGFETNQNPKPTTDLGHPGFINWWKWIGTQSIGVEGSFPYVEAQKSNRNTMQIDHSHYAADFLGQHELKYGVQYTKAEGNWQGGYFHGYANFAYPYPWDYGPAANWWWNGDQSWQWGTDDDPVFPIYNRKVFRNPWLTVRQSDSTGMFIDDSWMVSDRLTINLGLRYDRMKAGYGEGLVYEMPETPEDINNPTVLRTREGGDVFDFKTWSPRLGFALTLTEDQKTVLRGHVGRYYAPMGVESLRRFGPDMEDTKTETWIYYLKMSEVDLNKNGLVDFNEVRPATRLLASRAPTRLMSSTITDPSWYLEVTDGTESPYTDQFEISLQRQLGSDYSIEATFVRKETKNLIALRPYNTDTGNFWEWVPRDFTTWTGFKTKVWEISLKDYDGDGKADVNDAKFVLNNNRYRAVNVDEFAGKDAGRTFNGLQLVLTKRMSHRWQGLAAVNFADSDGIAPRTVDQNWYIDGPLVMDTPFGSTMNHFQNNLEGPLPMTPKMMAKISASYTVPVIETDIGLRYRYDSGRPIFPVQGVPTFQSWMSDLQAGTYLGTNWGEFIVADDPTDPDYTPATSIVDLSVSRRFPIGGYNLSVSLDVLNALNENAPNRFGYKQGDYGRVYSIVSPRIFRTGVKFSF